MQLDVAEFRGAQAGIEQDQDDEAVTLSGLGIEGIGTGLLAQARIGFGATGGAQQRTDIGLGKWNDIGLGRFRAGHLDEDLHRYNLFGFHPGPERRQTGVVVSGGFGGEGLGQRSQKADNVIVVDGGDIEVRAEVSGEFTEGIFIIGDGVGGELFGPGIEFIADEGFGKRYWGHGTSGSRKTGYIMIDGLWNLI